MDEGLETSVVEGKDIRGNVPDEAHAVLAAEANLRGVTIQTLVGQIATEWALGRNHVHKVAAKFTDYAGRIRRNGE